MVIYNDWFGVYKMFAEIDQINLMNKFNYLTEGMENWKMPFTCNIPSKHFEEYNEAAIHFTGAPLQVMCDDGTRSLVYCEGYYNTIGA